MVGAARPGARAISHAIAAGDADTAARIFGDHWLELFLQGRADAVLDAVEALPVTTAGVGDIRLAKALLLAQRGRLEAARSQIAAARSASELLPPADRVRFDDRAAVVDLFRTGLDHGLGAAVASGVALLRRLHGEGCEPDPAVRASAEVFVGMGEARLQSHGPAPLELLRSSAATAHATGLVALELTALAESCFPAVTEGRPGEVAALAADVLRRADARGWVGLATVAPAVAYLGWFDYWRGNLREAREQLERSLSMVLPFDWELRGLVLNFLTKTCLALGDLRSARRHAAEIGTMIESGRRTPWWPSMLTGLEGLLLLAEGRTRDAVALASEPTTLPEYALTPSHRARVLLRAGLPTEVLAELDRVPGPAPSCTSSASRRRSGPRRSWRWAGARPPTPPSSSR